MRVLLLSAYDAQSHQVWRKGLVQAIPSIDWTVETLPARFFAWRFRGNAFSWSNHPVLQGPFDLLVVTSMTDLATLRGFFPSLATCPAVVYFHENQFAYPLEQTHPRDLLHFQMTQLSTAWSADALLFNSQYNQDTFLQGAQTLLGKMPDAVPPEPRAWLAKHAQVLPVPLYERAFQSHLPLRGPLTLLWNHRWEFDKGPERFFAALLLLKEWGIAFEVHVVGQSFRTQPPCFAEAKSALKGSLKTWGYLSNVSDYWELLRRCDLVVSTALHEFQGLSVLEACASGCLPLVPDRLVYPQFFSKEWRYPSFLDDEKAEVRALATKIAQYAAEIDSLRNTPRLDLSSLSWETLGPKYLAILEEVAAKGRRVAGGEA